MLLGVYKPKDFATPVGDFGIVPQQLVLMSTDHNIASLQHYGEEQASESETKKLHQKFITISVERIRSMIRRKKVMIRWMGVLFAPKRWDLSLLLCPCGFACLFSHMEINVNDKFPQTSIRRQVVTVDTSYQIVSIVLRKKH